MWTHSACDDLIAQVRTQDCAAGLVALGRFVTGKPAYLGADGVALRGLGDTATPILDAAGNPAPGQAVAVPDPSLAALGVEIVRLPSAPVAEPDVRSCVGGAVWRAGLLLQMLDASYAHLSTRVSGGQKTLQHQLVKATFTECFALAEQVRLEAPHWLATPDGWALGEAQRRLTAASCKAAKLMGGHGYLRGSLNAMECLSLCVSSLLSGAGVAQARVAA